MRYTIYSLLFSTLFILCLLTGCKKPCNQSQVANLTFSQEDLGINPYTGHESLLFTSQTGDSCVLPNGHRGNLGQVTYEIDYETAKEYYNHCQGDFFYHEFNYLEKRNPVNTSGLNIYLSFAYAFNNPVTDKLFTAEFYVGNPVNYGFEGTYKFDQGKLFNYVARGSYLKDSVVSYHDSLLIGPGYYHHVYELFSHTGTIAFYSTNDGIVGFNTSNDDHWFLNKKY